MDHVKPLPLLTMKRISSGLYLPLIITAYHREYCIRFNIIIVLLLYSQMVLEELTDPQSTLVMDTVHECILSPDRYNIVRGLEILSGLSQVSRNEAVLIAGLNSIIYPHIVNLLCVHDIQLIVFTLECLYHLSDMKEEACDHIAMVVSAIGMYLLLVYINILFYINVIIVT